MSKFIHRIYIRGLASLFAVFLLQACSGEWSEFVEFSEKDSAGTRVDCDQLLSTKMERGFYETYYVDIFDYLYASSYEFNQCHAEIEAASSLYCTNGVDDIVKRIMHGDTRWPSEKILKLCKNELANKLKDVNYKYILPSQTNGMLTLLDNGEMIAPSTIRHISFGSDRIPGLKYLVLYTEDNSFSMYYGNGKIWLKAREEISSLVTINNPATKPL